MYTDVSLHVSSHFRVYRIAISVYVHVQYARAASGLDLVVFVPLRMTVPSHTENKTVIHTVR